MHGDGAQSRSFVFVADVVAHLLAAMRHAQAQPGSEVLNVCTGEATSILSVARTMAALGGHALELRHAAPRIGDIRRSAGSPDRASAILGVRAMTDLETGLLLTLQASSLAPSRVPGGGAARSTVSAAS